MANDEELTRLIAQIGPVEFLSREWFDALHALNAAIGWEFTENVMVPNVHGTHAVTPLFVAQQMLRLMRESRDPGNVVRWMRRLPELIGANERTGGLVKALYGVTCDDVVPLGESIALYPIQKLPSSRVTTHLLATHERAMDSNSSPISMGLIYPPRAALFRVGSLEAMRAAGQQWFEELNEAASLLAIVPNAAPVEAAHWFHFDDSDADLLYQLGLSAHLSEFPHSRRLTEPPIVTAAVMDGVFAGYAALKKEERDRITLALDRVIRSRCQFVAGNRAIDLATALEVLFMNKDRDEHSYKIAMRLSKLLHTDPAAERRIAFLETRRLYDLRSKMVHSGRITKDQWSVGTEKRTSSKLVEAGDLRCIEAVRKLIARGNIPDDDGWAEVELG